MELAPISLDILRGLHLAFFAAGLGTVLFHDFSTLREMRRPIDEEHIQSIKSLHSWIFWAFAGLWLTGITLIYVRTGFDLAQFSPKLWVKVSIMLLMTLNGYVISARVIPILQRSIGHSMTDIRPRVLTACSVLASVSMFCWTSGMVLGSSAYLKTAPWEILLPVVAIWFAACIIGGLGMVFWSRMRRTDVDLMSDVADL